MAAAEVGFNPTPWMTRQSNVLINLASSSPKIIDEYAEELGEILGSDKRELFDSLQVAIVKGNIESIIEILEGVSDEELYELVDRASSSIDKALKRMSIVRTLMGLHRQYRWVPFIRDPVLALYYLSCLLRLAYLYTGNRIARDASIITYAGAKIIRIIRENLREAAKSSMYYYSGARLYLNGYREEGLSLIGWGLKEHLIIKPVESRKNVIEDPRVWSSTLYVNYYTELAPLVDGKLLESWGYFRLLEQG